MQKKNRKKTFLALICIANVTRNRRSGPLHTGTNFLQESLIANRLIALINALTIDWGRKIDGQVSLAAIAMLKMTSNV